MYADTPMQHVVNATPAIATLGSMLAHLPDIISVLVGLAALIYYWLVISKLLRERRGASVKPTPEAD